MIVQFVRINGVAIENARWKINSLESLRTGDKIQFSFNIDDDTNIIQYIAKRANMDCVVERTEIPNDDKKRFQYSIILTGMIESIRHMIDTSVFSNGEHQIESMVTVVPFNRTIENVITYILDRDKCDRKFIALLT
jgi:hypothetical protein